MSSSLRQRVISAIIIGIPILLLVFYSDLSRTIFLGIIGLMMSWEYLSLHYKKPLINPLATLSIVVVALLMILAYRHPDTSFDFIVYASVIVNCILLYDLFFRESSIHSSAPWAWNILYIGLAISSMIAFHVNEQFASILISILLMIWISDTGAYFVGKSTGRRKLFPKVSPGKTWEGFYGAGLLSILFSYFFFSYFGSYNVSIWALIAIAIWLFGSFGDLVESKIKRSLNVKDSSDLIPGHGGFLDRFDSFVFCIPFVLLLVHLLK